jgi:hypothetical protein
MARLVVSIALLLTVLGPAEPARATLISRSQVAGAVQVVYLLEADHQPLLAVEHGHISQATIVSDSTGGWRATVSATLDECQGALTVDGTEIVEQRCVWMSQILTGGL